jgi:hypothetical protein
VPFDRARECAEEIARRIAVCATGRDGIAEDLAAVLQRAVRGFVHAPRLNPTQSTEQLGCSNRLDRLATEPSQLALDTHFGATSIKASTS